MATVEVPTTTLGERLEYHRQSMIPVPSFRQIERRMVTRIGEHAPSSETLRRWHRPTTDEHEVDLFILVVLAELYGTKVANLSESAADLLSDLGFSRSRCTALIGTVAA